MGQEATITATWNGTTSHGKAMLEGDHLLLRGETRVKLMLADLTGANVAGDDLVLTTPDGTLSLALGAAKAADWLHRIQNPKTVLDKLGVKAGQRIALRGQPPDPVLAAELSRGGVTGDAGDDADLILLVADAVADLDAVSAIAPGLGLKSGLWIIYPKGRRDMTQEDVFTAGRGAGLVDNKVCAVSPTHTALKFVRRKA
ncbi:DUF3052 family protein [Niveispirillum cyanobacteriorum]|uniref:DUF3052 domain-containing protein n=1 Tax=Niveispirillum cyanobacteriorum TaxID=1612173 RepID=A0A2K9NC80_9PROT|nr:DUF3052 family protein [Niveispirillum cyanobacteriorum]AUN30718.1 DUF3052 domain-containing protein [Niveispirillum cyanobacteriorum]GGE51992.1 hypothetical protein GCM10011317_07840 [Niveispirillum cyanobacteriorum]